MEKIRMFKMLLGGGIAIFSLALNGQTLAQEGAWTTKSPMPGARWAVSGDTINGTLYVAGGVPVNNTCGYLSTLEAYDPATDTWSTKASMPTGREAFDVGVIDNILYAVGGGIGCGVYVATNEAYDPVTNSWTTKAPMPTVRRSHGIGVVNGILYAVGGHDNNGSNFLTSVVAYDPTADAWTMKAPIPTPRNQLGVGVISGVLYAVGGHNNASILSTVEAYDPALDSWTTKAPMPRERYSPRVEVLNGILYAVGGSNNSGYIPEVDAYDPLTDTWTTVASLPTPRTDHAAAVSNGVLYAIGGHNGNPLATNEAFVPEAPPHEFKINFTTFIPGNNLAGPPQTRVECRGGLFFSGDSRSFDPAASSFRTRQLVTVITDESVDADGLKDGTDQNLVGETKSYHSDALPILDSADDDNVLHDCHLLHDRGTASRDGMNIVVNRTGPHQVTVHMFGGAANPLINLAAVRRLSAINWTFTLIIDASGANPQWTIHGVDDGFPAFEIYINDTPIYTRNAPPPYSFEDLSKLFPRVGDRFVSLSGELP